MEHSIRAFEGRNRSVVYLAPDGVEARRVGGTRSWRNNNPGNIRGGAFARRHQSIGEAGGFAVFESYESGRSALRSLLGSSNYRALTIREAISRYAPSSENNTNNYLAVVSRHSRLDENRRILDLNQLEKRALVDAIIHMEGYRVGETVESYERSSLSDISNGDGVGARMRYFENLRD